MKSLFEQNGGTYSALGDYQVPNLTAPDMQKYNVGVWGRRRLAFLKAHRRVLYVNLLTSGKLYEHLREIDTAAVEQHENIVQQMAVAQDVTEKLKATNQMLWVGMMNNIRASANEIIQNELIYN